MGNRNLIKFDWAIKRLLRNKADFSVLEGFLSELLKESMVIETVLESEGNQLSPTDKFNRVDLLVKNTKGELVIIEVQNQSEFDYFHRMAYGTSKAITEYISLGETYSNIKKVYSINIVYFDFGQGDDYIYHGKTDFIGVHNSDKLILSSSQMDALGKIEPYQIFPEYYVIKVNKFDDIAKNTLDQWIYYFKNNEIKDDFTAQGIDKARDLWRFDNLSEIDQKIYKRHLNNLHYSASMEMSMKLEVERKVREEGREEGKKEGKKEGIRETAIKLKENGVDIATIINVTGLAKSEIDLL